MSLLQCDRISEQTAAHGVGIGASMVVSDAGVITGAALSAALLTSGSIPPARLAAAAYTGITRTGTRDSDNVSADASGGAIAVRDDSSGGSGAHTLVSYQRAEVQVGSISVTNTVTGFNTSSDARLKHDLGPADVAACLDILRRLVIRDFQWLVDGAPARGVFAQEAHEVKPSAVNVGTDEIDETSGALKQPWAVDYSKFVPEILVGVQYLLDLVAHQDERIGALESVVSSLPSLSPSGGVPVSRARFGVIAAFLAASGRLPSEPVRFQDLEELERLEDAPPGTQGSSEVDRAQAIKDSAPALTAAPAPSSSPAAVAAAPANGSAVEKKLDQLSSDIRSLVGVLTDKKNAG